MRSSGERLAEMEGDREHVVAVVELVRASLVPTSELMTLDFPTFERPRKATSGIVGAGK